LQIITRNASLSHGVRLFRLKSISFWSRCVFYVYNTLPLERATAGCYGRSVAHKCGRRSLFVRIVWTVYDLDCIYVL